MAYIPPYLYTYLPSYSNRDFISMLITSIQNRHQTHQITFSFMTKTWQKVLTHLVIDMRQCDHIYLIV